jgi:hypothetical protein
VTPLEVAQQWAAEGVAAFPVLIGHNANGKLTKNPVPGSHGHRDATTDVDQLNAMFDRAAVPDGQHLAVGLVPGSADMIVVDIDCKGAADGFATAAEVGVPDGFTVTTPSGGEHRWFRKPVAGRIGNLSAPGIDVRADAGFVVAPGTTTPWGSWETVCDASDITTLPADVLEKLRGARDTNATTDAADIDKIFTAEPSSVPVDAALGEWVRGRHHGRHPAALKAVTKLLRLAERGHPGVADAVEIIRGNFTTLVTKDGSRTAEQAQREWSDMVRDAKRTVSATPATSPRYSDPDTDTHGLEERTLPPLIRGLEITKLPRPEWLVEGVIATPSLALLVGPPKHGKSFAALDLAASVATGRPWMDRPTKRSSVLYVIGEGIGGVGLRINALSSYTGDTDALDDLCFLEGARQLTSVRDLEELEIRAREINAGLIVLDTLARCTVGVEENSAKEMGAVIEHGLQRLRDATGAAVLAVHHTGKDTSAGPRGSSALLGAVDTEIVCDKKGETIRLQLRNQKDGADGHTATYHLEPVEQSAVLVPGGVMERGKPKCVDELLEVLRETAGTDGLPCTRWEQLSELSQSSFYRGRKWLVDHYLVRNVGTQKRPRYVPATSGTADSK